MIIDAQLVTTTTGMSQQKGYDGGKKVTGGKRYIAVDSQGNMVATGLTSPGMHDKPGAASIKEQVEDRER